MLNYNHGTCTLPIAAERGESMADPAAEPGQTRLPSREEAEQNYNEAMGEAVEACAADTAGQRCYICLDGAAGEGLVRGCSCRGASGFAHVSCLAEQAKILRQEAEENNLDAKARTTAFRRWDTCSMCKQDYHGVVACALGWACWKLYAGRPETDQVRGMAMSVVGNGLHDAKHYEDALSVQEAQLSMMRRRGAPEEQVLVVQGNLAISYGELGHHEKTLSMEQDVYSGWLKLQGEEDPHTLQAALNYGCSLLDLQRFEEAKALLRKTVPLARRVLGESDPTTLKMRKIFAEALYLDDGATLDDFREAVTTLEDTERNARRVLGGAHPTTAEIGVLLRIVRATLAAREGDTVSSVCNGVAAMTPRGA